MKPFTTKMTSLLWNHLYSEHSQLAHYFLLTSLFLSQLAKCYTPLWVTRKMNKFNKQTGLNVKHYCFIFQH